MSIQKRTDTNGKIRWIARYYGINGKEYSKSFAFQKDAKAWEREQNRNVERGTWTDPTLAKITLGELILEMKENSQRHGTKKTWQVLYNRLDTLQDASITKVRRTHVQQWVNNLMTEPHPLMASTAKEQVAKLSTAFEHARKDDLIALNPCKDVHVKTPDTKVHDDELLTHEQVEELISIANAENEVLGTALQLAAYTGMRKGELVGLRVNDIDFMRGVIHVRHQKTYATGHVLQPLKTSTSKRDIPIPDELIFFINSWITQKNLVDNDFILTSPRGPWANSALGKAFGKFSGKMRDQKYPKSFTLHTFRHFYASSLIGHGVDVKTVSLCLGHANPSTTLNTYTHLWPTGVDNARNAISSVMRAEYGQTPDLEQSKDPSNPVQRHI